MTKAANDVGRSRSRARLAKPHTDVGKGVAKAGAAVPMLSDGLVKLASR